MTKKQKALIYILIIISLHLKEEVYNLLFKRDLKYQTYTAICNIKNKTIEEKYQELVEAYGYEDTVNYNVEASKILYRNIYNLNDTITIYKGSNSEIHEKNLVINEEGLVGIVKKVNKESSEVDLLLKENVNLSVKINDSYGILKYKENKLVVEGINNKATIKEGDKITTSDISIYPENNLVGYISEITDNNYEIEKLITVTPAVNFENLKYVSIIKDLRGEK